MPSYIGRRDAPLYLTGSLENSSTSVSTTAIEYEIPVPGAQVGDVVVVSHDIGTSNEEIAWNAHVSAAGVVNVRAAMASSATSETVRAGIIRVAVLRGK